MRKVGILTGGGDAPGLNAVIRAVTLKADKEGYEVIGFKRGWAGTLERDYQKLTPAAVEDIHREGGTILGSSRTNPAKVENGFQKTKETLEELDIYALVAAGGEDTLGVAEKLSEMGVKVVGAPKTIDNDLSATDYTFGFHTAIDRVAESLDRLHTTAKSHNRVIVVEIMGRHSGWMALYGGIAGGAHAILIPEFQFEYGQLCELINKRYDEGKKYAIIAVAEGTQLPQLGDILKEAPRDEFGQILFTKIGGIAKVLSERLEEDTGKETRHMVLGHLQRGGRPSAFDRVLGTRVGFKTIEMINKRDFGKMAALQNDEIVSVPFEDALKEVKKVNQAKYEMAKAFFG